MKQKSTIPLHLLILTFISAVAITVTGFLFRQSFFRILPLFVSLIIGVLQARANRYALLLGSFNSLLYGVVYTGFALYANAAYTVFVSFPVQLITFLRWKKRSYMHSTRFQQMHLCHWLVTAISFTLCFIAVNFVLTEVNSGYRLLDNSSTLLGLAVSILTVFAFREYTWFMVINGVLTIVLYSTMAADDPAQITYLIYSVHSFICIVEQFFCVRSLYAQQKKEEFL